MNTIFYKSIGTGFSQSWKDELSEALAETNCQFRLKTPFYLNCIIGPKISAHLLYLKIRGKSKSDSYF